MRAAVSQSQSSISNASSSAVVTTTKNAHRIVNLLTTLMRRARDLLDFVMGNDILMEHLDAELCILNGKMKKLASDIESGIIHPQSFNPMFY